MTESNNNAPTPGANPEGALLSETMEDVIAPEPLSDNRAERFYDRIRASIAAYLKRRGKTLGEKADFLLLVPDVFILLWRLAKDDRVTGKNKVLLGSGLAYYIFPLDFAPEAWLGPLGFFDDLVFGVYILNKMLVDTDEAVLREHWSGRDELLATMRRVLRAADGLVAGDFLKQVKKMVK